MNQEDKLEEELNKALRLRAEQSKKIRQIKKIKKQKNINNIGKTVLKQHKKIKSSEDFKKNYSVVKKEYREILDAFTVIVGIDSNTESSKLYFRNTEEINNIFNQNINDAATEKYKQIITDYIYKIQNKS
ncbi:hypothetical protein LNP07_06725 [Apilactobacillus sp. M161]|uniref:Uncharacterized protein n=1 Tax=Apilactobacillus xinyiensis TaxID=2841032 RepID=A0ABT0I3B7_9LACO|nr:hypothetical protein [Apilactobacillus xinyiensis]MCK8625208.1 hypothetical protein [Apilactobacillus xinyiensis]